jgi:hypothetical protein
MSTILEPWRLVSGNGAVPDLTTVGQWPSNPTGKTTGRERTIAPKPGPAALHVPEVVICEHINFGGVNERTNLNWYYVGGWWNDRISSIIVVSGTWRFYEHWHYEGRYWDLTPNYYPWVEAVGIPNDLISSFQVIAF